MALTRRLLGAASRRLGRPELLAVLDPVARQTLREEIAIRALLAAALSADSLYVDVGANRGQVLREAVRVAPGGAHVAFEPIPSVAAELARSFPGVDCRVLALGARPESASFWYFTKLDGWSGLRRSPEISDERGAPELIDVTVSTLDVELAGRRPAVVKIDVEGAELAVIEGAGDLLSSARPLVLFEHVAAAASLYGASSSALWERLADLGYEIFAVTGEGPLAREEFAEPSAVVNWLARPS